MLRKFILFIIFYTYSISITAEELVPVTGTGYVLVCKDHSPVYSKASTHSKQIITLPIGSEVIIIKKKMLKINGKDELWYLIDTRFTSTPERKVKLNNQWKSETYKGWIESERLVGKNNFVPVDGIDEFFIFVSKSDDTDSFRIFSDGTVKYKDPLTKRYRRGFLYRFNNIYAIVFEGTTDKVFYLFLIFNDEGSIHVPFSSGVEVIRDKSQFPF